VWLGPDELKSSPSILQVLRRQQLGLRIWRLRSRLAESLHTPHGPLFPRKDWPDLLILSIISLSIRIDHLLAFTIVLSHFLGTKTLLHYIERVLNCLRRLGGFFVLRCGIICLTPLRFVFVALGMSWKESLEYISWLKLIVSPKKLSHV
jgi:hypothetical protein